MQTIEFDATAHKHTIPIPESVPDGVLMRVVLFIDDDAQKSSSQPEKTQEGGREPALKALLASMTEGLTEDDLFRPLEYGRELPEWDT